MRKSPLPPSSNRRNSLLALAAAAVILPGLPCQAQTAQELGITEHSAFAFPADGRDPFLPVGWERPQEAQPTDNTPAPIQPVLKPEMFVVTSISLDRIRLAVINGKPYGEGDNIPLDAEGKRGLRVQVLTIQDGLVTLVSGSLKLTCPLRLSQTQAPAAKKP